MPKIIHTVGNMVNLPTKEELCLHEDTGKIVFVGKMSYEPNIVAVTYFVNEIFPRLVSEYPDLRFIIVGANPDGRVKQLEQVKGVSVTGFVDSVAEYFCNATIVVAPMLTGAGIQNKIIQAMSYGCCVATTPIGAEGLRINEKEIAIYNSKEEWVCGISSLLKNPTERREMGLRSRNYVINNLSKEVVAQQFWRFIDASI